MSALGTAVSLVHRMGAGVPADGSPAPTPSPLPTGLPREIDPAIVTPGWVGLAFFLVLFVALFFLMRSMIKQLRRIDIPAGGTPTHVDEAPPAADGEAAGPVPDANA